MDAETRARSSRATKAELLRWATALEDENAQWRREYADLQAALADAEKALRTARQTISESYDGKDYGCACPYPPADDDDHCIVCVEIMGALARHPSKEATSD